jgi:ABC-2 type transport system permease protein
VIKDPANRTILFVPVLMQSVLFGYGATFDLTNVLCRRR